VGQATLEAWLRDRAANWPMHLVIHRARIVDRFLDFLAVEGSIPGNPLSQLRSLYGQRTSTPIVRALLAANPKDALELLRPLPHFASFLGKFLYDHIALMRSLGYRYDTQAARFLRFDRFLQVRSELAGQPPTILLKHWTSAYPTLEHAWQCEELGRDLAKAWHHVDPDIAMPNRDRYLKRQIVQRQRRPYIYTENEIELLLETALQFPSPRSALRPLTLYTMLVLAYCSGLRIGEIVHLDLGDVNLHDGEIAIRDTKFFKSRTLPIAGSVVAALDEFLNARRLAGAPQHSTSGLFWHEQRAGRYSYVMAEKLLVRVLRRAGLKPDLGRKGPRIHDLRHAFVVNRMLTWYREGINPQVHLPYLATYMGHKDINSTLVYLTITKELLEEANERFRSFGVHNLHIGEGTQS
jgi:integrase